MTNTKRQRGRQQTQMDKESATAAVSTKSSMDTLDAESLATRRYFTQDSPADADNFLCASPSVILLCKFKTGNKSSSSSTGS